MARGKKDFFIISSDRLAFAPLSKLKYTSMKLQSNKPVNPVNGDNVYICFANVNGNTVVIGLWLNQDEYKKDTYDMFLAYDDFMEKGINCSYRFQRSLNLNKIYHWFKNSPLESVLCKSTLEEVAKKFNYLL